MTGADPQDTPFSGPTADSVRSAPRPERAREVGGALPPRCFAGSGILGRCSHPILWVPCSSMSTARPRYEFIGLSGRLPRSSRRAGRGRGGLRLRCPGQPAGLRAGRGGLGGGSRGSGLRLARRTSPGLGHHGDRGLVPTERASAHAGNARLVARGQIPDRPRPFSAAGGLRSSVKGAASARRRCSRKAAVPTSP